MNIEKAIRYLETIKREYNDDEIEQAVDIAIEAIQNKDDSLKRIMNDIKEIYDKESKEINRLPENLNYYLWVRRGLILAQQIIQKEMDKYRQE